MYDDDEGWWHPAPFLYGDDGPCLSRRCRCGRILRLPQTVMCSDDRMSPKTRAQCSRCGDVRPIILCWGGDLP